MLLPDFSRLALGHEEAATGGTAEAKAPAAARWAKRPGQRDQPNGPVDEKADRARAASVRVQECELELADERRKSKLRHQATEQLYKEILDASERRHKAEQAAIDEQRGVEDMAYDNAVEQRCAVKKEYSAQKEGTSKGSPEREGLKAEAWSKLKRIEDDLNTMLDLFALPIAKRLSAIRSEFDAALAQAKAKFDRTMEEVTTRGG